MPVYAAVKSTEYKKEFTKLLLPKALSYASVVNCTGKIHTFPERIAVLELKDTDMTRKIGVIVSKVIIMKILPTTAWKILDDLLLTSLIK